MASQPQTLPITPPKRAPARIDWTRLLIYVILILGALASALPFLYMIMTSFKTYGDIINNNFWPWPPLGNESLQLQNYPDAITNVGFDKAWQVPLVVRYFANSIIVTVVSVLGIILTSIFAAYALARMDLPGKNFIFILILATLMIPPDLTLVPKIVMMFNFGWYNTYLALIVPFLASVFSIFLLRQFFMQIPKDLFDAALIDGAGHLRYLFAIVLPLSKPAIVTTALLNFIWAWDSFKWPLLVTRDSNMRVVAVGLQQFMASEGGTKVQLLMAFAAMVVVPVLVFYFITQKYFKEGVITTGIKG